MKPRKFLADICKKKGKFLTVFFVMEASRMWPAVWMEAIFEYTRLLSTMKGPLSTERDSIQSISPVFICCTHCFYYFLLAICDHNGAFLYFSSRWPGASHDSFIFKHSDVWSAFEEGRFKGYILGDSGYGSRRWLLTPYANPDNDSKKRYIYEINAFDLYKGHFSFTTQLMLARGLKWSTVLGTSSAASIRFTLKFD
jgi:hypothetical protein